MRQHIPAILLRSIYVLTNLQIYEKKQELEVCSGEKQTVSIF